MTETALSILELSEQYLNKFELTMVEASETLNVLKEAFIDQGRSSVCCGVAYALDNMAEHFRTLSAEVDAVMWEVTKCRGAEVTP